MDITEITRHPATVAAACVVVMLAGCTTVKPPGCDEAQFKLTPSERAAKFKAALTTLTGPGLLELRGVDSEGRVAMTFQGICAVPTEPSAVPSANLALTRVDYTKCEPPVIVIYNACYLHKP